MSTLEVLKKARALIEREEDWCQGRMEDYDGNHCALGAVAVSVVDGPLSSSVFKMSERVEYD